LSEKNDWGLSQDIFMFLQKVTTNIEKLILLTVATRPINWGRKVRLRTCDESQESATTERDTQALVLLSIEH